MSDDFYTIKTAPASAILDFAALSAWMKDIDASEQALVEALISAAAEKIETMSNRVLQSTTFVGQFSGFESSDYESEKFVELRRSPFTAVNSVKVNGAVLSASDYIVKESSAYCRILFPGTYTIDDTVAYPIEIDFDAGWAKTPDSLKLAVRQLVLFWYENRGDVSADQGQSVPAIVRTLARQYKIVSVYG